MGRLKPVFRCPDFSKDHFKDSRFLLTISVGQEVHENEHFESTIELVNSAFASCVMLIDDTLQRHTMALDTEYDAQYFYQRSLVAGDEWLLRNKKYYSKLSIPVEILRWNHWLDHKNYVAQKNEILRRIENDPDYANAFTETIDEFLRRYHARLLDQDSFDFEKARALCRNYLIEECAAMSLWPETKCHFEVYPSRRNLVMTETHRLFVLPRFPDLLHAVAIKFKNRKQFKPQVLQVAEAA